MTYSEAIALFDILDEEGKIKDVYAHFGSAVYFAQVLEQQSINMIAICMQWKNKVVKEQEVQALWDEYDFGSRTFGKLISEIKSLYQLSEEDSVELKKVLKLRNYIAHDYFRFNTELFYTISGQKRMIKDFTDFQESAQAMDKKLLNYLKFYLEKMGLTDEYFAHIMEETKKVWSNKVIDEKHKTIIK